MAHQRLRKFNTATVYEGGKIANDMCMVVRAGNIIFLRGQTGFDLDNRFVGRGDAAAQADQAMKNVKVLLEEAGGKLDHICKITTYITDRAYREPRLSLRYRSYRQRSCLARDAGRDRHRGSHPNG